MLTLSDHHVPSMIAWQGVAKNLSNLVYTFPLSGSHMSLRCHRRAPKLPKKGVKRRRRVIRCRFADAPDQRCREVVDALSKPNLSKTWSARVLIRARQGTQYRLGPFGSTGIVGAHSCLELVMISPSRKLRDIRTAISSGRSVVPQKKASTAFHAIVNAVI